MNRKNMFSGGGAGDFAFGNVDDSIIVDDLQTPVDDDKSESAEPDQEVKNIKPRKATKKQRKPKSSVKGAEHTGRIIALRGSIHPIEQLRMEMARNTHLAETGERLFKDQFQYDAIQAFIKKGEGGTPRALDLPSITKSMAVDKNIKITPNESVLVGQIQLNARIEGVSKLKSKESILRQAIVRHIIKFEKRFEIEPLEYPNT